MRFRIRCYPYDFMRFSAAALKSKETKKTSGKILNVTLKFANIKKDFSLPFIHKYIVERIFIGTSLSGQI